MKIATFNVNSIKARLPNVVEWLQTAAPDVALLQEIKCTADGFPFLEIESAGYACAVHGQKTYNGVAILTRKELGPIEDLREGLPEGDGDDHARYLEATVAGVRVASIYLPNGNPIATEKFGYKLAWMDRLTAHAAALRHSEMPVVLGGDYNVCPTDDDLWDPVVMAHDALTQPQSRARFRALLHLGYTEAWRALHSEAHQYSFWDYQAGRWQKDQGLRIDHLLLSPQAADRLVDCQIDRVPRGKLKASDHTPVWVELSN
ncbi:MAG: exodeoxyribonuclease III [Alphaproteobacteria bacterium]